MTIFLSLMEIYQSGTDLAGCDTRQTSARGAILPQEAWARTFTAWDEHLLQVAQEWELGLPDALHGLRR